MSYGSIPSILLAPHPLAVRQWRKLYSQGKAAAPPLAALSAMSFSFLAYKLSKTLNQTKGELYALAALSTISIVPYTLIVMRATNDKLTNKANDSETWSIKDEEDGLGLEKGKSAKELLDWWGLLNFARGMFPLIGAGLGAWASFT